MDSRTRAAINRRIGAGGYLNSDELSRSRAAGNHFADIDPETVFGPKANGNLASLIHRESPEAYIRLRTEYEYRIGERRRPDDHFGRASR